MASGIHTCSSLGAQSPPADISRFLVYHPSLARSATSACGWKSRKQQMTTQLPWILRQRKFITSNSYLRLSTRHYTRTRRTACAVHAYFYQINCINFSPHFNCLPRKESQFQSNLSGKTMFMHLQKVSKGAGMVPWCSWCTELGRSASSSSAKIQGSWWR